MNTIMGHATLKPKVFYRHKKFDQAKRECINSFGSIASHGELGNSLEIERKSHPFLSNITLSHFNWPVLETKSKRNHSSDSNTDQQLPAAKRSCNFTVAFNRDHCEDATKIPQSFTVSPTAQLQQTKILANLEKGFKRKFTADANNNKELHLAKRSCGTASKLSNMDQYTTLTQEPDAFTTTSKNDQYLSSFQMPYTANVNSNNNQPLTRRNCTSNATSFNQASNTSHVTTRIPALEKEAQRNLPAVADINHNMAPPTRPRSFSASTSRSGYQYPHLNRIPLTNMPLALLKSTTTGFTPASSTNQHDTIKPVTTSQPKSCAYGITSASEQHKTSVPEPNNSTGSFLTYPGMANILPDLAKAANTNFTAALNANQDITPVTRQRSFSAGTGSLAYSMQPPWTKTSLTLNKQRGLTSASNTALLQSPAQTLPLNYSAGTRSRSSSFGVANTLSSSSNKELKKSFKTALSTVDHSIAPATRPRSYSASTTSSASSFASLTQLCQANKAVSAPVILPTILPKINHETIHNICKYHGNMVRKFPKKERTPKDQERRNKNTIACRLSRRVKKLEHIAIEEQYKELTQKTFEIIEQSMRATAYLHELMKLCKCPEEETESPVELTKTERLPVTAQEKKPFTIAFLAGTEEK